MKDTSPANEWTFVIVQPDPLVLMDLAGTLQTAFPDTNLVLCRLASEGERHILSSPVPVCAVVSTAAMSPNMRDALRDCVARDGQVVVIGHADDLDFKAAVVDTPFSTSMILDALPKPLKADPLPA